MKLKNISLAIGAFGVLALANTTAEAAVYTIDNQASGYVSDGGNFTGIRPNTNYLVGLCNASNCLSAPGEYRDFFYFVIPKLDGPIASAILSIPTRGVTLNQSTTTTYQVTSLDIEQADLGPLSFAGLGTGTFYGSREYTVADASTTQTIDLSAAALAALGDGSLTFALGGRLSSPTDFTTTAPDQLLFGRSQNQISQLIITTVPLPATMPMMLFGLSGLSLSGYRSSKKRKELAAS
ncbi:hypothetical protein IVG45_13890 [Methylomonas sp. LL1]|uniref:hypothetical protein n=1 Tax=Methylomonas sp. LL1 TaxID=2785785 RepID=UPI0018C39BD1|nr:hypothetical protein [Methylomonas sp. LL1]QPK61950.1 hypothetical protein IVG45_13890 [Methylomonas sp. LL1]